MNFYGKWYKTDTAGNCRIWHHFSICIFKKEMLDKKLFGYWNMYYDGYFHFFNLWPFMIRWSHRAITELEYIESHLE
jgi:hypothetical protein